MLGTTNQTGCSWVQFKRDFSVINLSAEMNLFVVPCLDVKLTIASSHSHYED